MSIFSWSCLTAVHFCVQQETVNQINDEIVDLSSRMAAESSGKVRMAPLHLPRHITFVSPSRVCYPYFMWLCNMMDTVGMFFVLCYMQMHAGLEDRRLQAPLLQMELDRVKFMLTAYLRARLKKVPQTDKNMLGNVLLVCRSGTSGCFILSPSLCELAVVCTHFLPLFPLLLFFLLLLLFCRSMHMPCIV
jgi:hypothetical protein